MWICYLTQWFDPEPNVIKGPAFVRALQAAGHEVTVVTGLPNYPTGRIYPGYRMRLIQSEMIDGVKVVRLPLYPSHDASSLRRSLNFLSFFASALVWGLVRRERFDLAYVYHPPITVGLAAALSGWVRGLPFVLDVQDLWPDTIAATGMSGARSLAGVLGAICQLVYRRAAAIVVQSDGMNRTLQDRGVPAGKVTVIRNWADPAFTAAAAPVPGERGRFTVVYGGNLGRAQGLQSVVDAAALVRAARDDVDIVLYGDGLEAEALKARAARSAPAAVRFEPRLPQQEVIRRFAAADALLIHLADDPLFAITIPSKTQAYLAMGRPIVAGVAGETAQLLEDSGAALVAPPGDAKALAAAILELAAMPEDQRLQMGRSGQAWYRANLSFEQGVARTLRLLEGTHHRTGGEQVPTP